MTDLAENDIRPHDLMQGSRVAMLVDAGRMLARREEFVYVDCPACGMSNYREQWNKYGFDYVCCNECDTMYINPRPTPEILHSMHSDSVNYAYWNKHIFPASEAARRKSIFVPRVDRTLALCKRYGIATDALLEVGCGFGTFLEEMNTRGVFNAMLGVESTESLANTCRERGLPVINDAFENMSPGIFGCFDVVASFEVIEHVFSPFDFVNQCRQFLSPGGLLILSCPNGRGFDFVTLGRECANMDHEHQNYFNPASLTKLVQRCGLEVLECSTPGKLDAELVRTAIVNGTYEAEPFLRQVLVDNWETAGQKFQAFLADSLLSSSLLMVARNP